MLKVTKIAGITATINLNKQMLTYLGVGQDNYLLCKSVAEFMTYPKSLFGHHTISCCFCIMPEQDRWCRPVSLLATVADKEGQRAVCVTDTLDVFAKVIGNCSVSFLCVYTYAPVFASKPRFSPCWNRSHSMTNPLRWLALEIVSHSTCTS